MAKITIIKTDICAPENMVSVSEFLFKTINGFTKDDRTAWRRFWKKLAGMQPGEMAVAEMVFPRSGKYHRRHMAIEQAVYDAQERFDDFEQFRYWLKVGAAWVTWAAGPKGGVVPIPKSISYARADEEEFRRYHVKVVGFLRGEHAAKYLWPHLDKQVAADMMDSILRGFDE